MIERQTWELRDLYGDDDAFRRERDAVVAEFDSLQDDQGHLAESSARLLSTLERMSILSKRLGRLYTYAMLRSDGDTRVASAMAAKQELEVVFTDYARRTSWLRPEILALPDGTIERYITQEPGLGPHAHFLRDLLRQKEHVLGASEERLLAEAGRITGGASSLFTVLHNADLPRPDVELSDGTEVHLTPAEFAKHRTTTVREDRRVLFEAHFGAYESFRATIGTNLQQAVQTHVFQARARRYGSCLEAALSSDNVPVSVYHNLVGRIRSGLGTMHRYFGLRARALGLDRIAYHDVHCPIGPAPAKRYGVEEVRRLVLEAMEPLGDRYVATLERAFDERWVDWHPRPGKRSGAYSAGSAYDVHPYVLMNFNGDHDGLTTFAHEAGHAMHSFLSNGSQPYPCASYSIFVAEVASTFNEALLLHMLLERAESRDERLALLAIWLDGLRATMFRQTFFAEFELAIHERAERGEALTGESISELYLSLLRHHQGHDEGACDVEDRYGIEWASVPHFYYDFYVYQYATGIVAATALAERVLSGDPSARDRYLEFLASGGSDYPLVLLRRAGVDLESAEPYEATFGAMERRLDELESLL